MNSATPLTVLNIDIGPEVSPILGDENYRMVLKAKIIENQWKGTKQEIYDFWDQFFPANPILILDNQDMTMDIIIYGMAPGIQQDLVRNGYIVPKPAGVGINYNFPTQPLFAYEYETPYLAGYDIGYWATA
jgi:hypothetical protein